MQTVAQGTVNIVVTAGGNVGWSNANQPDLLFNWAERNLCAIFFPCLPGAIFADLWPPYSLSLLFGTGNYLAVSSAE